MLILTASGSFALVCWFDSYVAHSSKKKCGLACKGTNSRSRRRTLEPESECHTELDVNIDCDVGSFMDFMDYTENALHTIDPRVSFGIGLGAYASTFGRRSSVPSSKIIFGGTASDGSMEFLFAYVLHCTNGTHAVTGEKGCGKIDYFNAHQKGARLQSRKHGADKNFDPRPSSSHLLGISCRFRSFPRLGNSDTLSILENELPLAEAVYKMVSPGTHQHLHLICKTGTRRFAS